MVNLLPAVLLGGPPHAGKSVLLYNLTHALQERRVRHHAIRACPDGEGNWFQEGDAKTVSDIRSAGKWSPEFVQRITFNLEHRCLPFLVDMGGHPKAGELPLFRQCTHAVLLLRADEPDSTRRWQHMIEEANLLPPLAQLTSQLQGTSTIIASSTLLKGTITGLERQSQIVRADPVFIELVERIATLFNSYSLADLERAFLEQAPGGLVLDLPTALCAYTTSIWWEPEMLAPFLKSLPEESALSVYGKAPNWLYAALAVHAVEQPFYLFDPKLPFGWVEPARVYLGETHSSEIDVTIHSQQDRTILQLTIPSKRLEYFQPDALAFPPVPTEQGLILDGPIPYWLLTALMRLYRQAGVPWIATHHVPPTVRNTTNASGPHALQPSHAVVAYSRVDGYRLGDLVTLSIE